MGLLDLFFVASMPVLKVLLLTALGSVLALNRIDILGENARKQLNTVVFFVFNPALVSSNLAKTVTFESVLLLWFMPFNVLTTFLIGSALGWILVKITRPPQHLKGLILGCCAAGNMGNLPLIIIPAVCREKGSPFGAPDACHTYGMAYASLSMAVPILETSKHYLRMFSRKMNLKALFTPTTTGAIIGFIIGVVPKIRNFIIGGSAPLRVVPDSASLIGLDTLPALTLILGGNLLKGLKRSGNLQSIIIGIIAVRYIFLPLLGILIVKGAIRFGLVHSDPLYQIDLLLQYAVPPAMNIGTITQFFGAGESECSVIMLWAYGLASVSLTLWSAFFMWLVA